MLTTDSDPSPGSLLAALTTIHPLPRGERVALSWPLELQIRFRRQLFDHGLGFGRIAPFGLVGTIAPGARAVERMHAELLQLRHFANPVRPHPERMVVRRLADSLEP